jgi:hypothetical protein
VEGPRVDCEAGRGWQAEALSQGIGVIWRFRQVWQTFYQREFDENDNRGHIAVWWSEFSDGGGQRGLVAGAADVFAALL